MQITINTFPQKCAKINKNLLPVISELVLYWTDHINKEAAKNLSGPHYGKDTNYRGPMTGQMPIPRITSMLAQSLTVQKVLKNGPYITLTAIFPDKRRAPYAGIVHDGTRYIRPRRFLQDPISEWKHAILFNWEQKILQKIREDGQAI